MKNVTIYADGACSGNPGKGGWGAVLKFGATEKELSGFNPHTTNNQMELLGVIEALKSLKEPCEVNIYSDSKYVVQGCNEWMSAWIKNSWRTSTNKPVKNIDFWKQLQELIQFHETKFHWVKGHADNAYNNRCDELARQAILDS